MIDLENSQNLTQKLHADLIHIDNFNIRKVFSTDNNTIDSVEIDFILTNIVTTIDDARLSMNVYKNDEFYEEIDMFRVNELIPGSNEFIYQYSPANGWSNEEYSFEIVVYKDYFDSSNTVIVRSVQIDTSDEVLISVANANSLEDYLKQSIPYSIIVFLMMCIMLLIVLLNKRIKMSDSFIPLTVNEILDDIFAVDYIPEEIKTEDAVT